MNEKIPFADILTQILDVVNTPEEEKTALVKSYEDLSTQRFLTLFIDTLADDTKGEMEKAVKEANTNPDAEDFSDDQMKKIFETMDATIPEEEKAAMYVTAKATILMELIEPLLTDGTEEETAAIGTILAKYPVFKNIIAAYDSQPS